MSQWGFSGAGSDISSDTASPRHPCIIPASTAFTVPECSTA